MSAATGTPSTASASTSGPTLIITPILPLPITSTSSSTTSTATSASSSSSSSGASSSSSESRSSSSGTSSGASSTSSTASTSSSTSQTSSTTSSSTTNLPAVITEVSTTFVSQSQSSTPTAAVVKNNTTGNAFFANKGAVAGVFSVVGLIGLVILIALILNIIRRRETKKFEKELRKATQEAANATAPHMELDDDYDPKHNGYHDPTYDQDAFMRGPAVNDFYPPYVGNGAGIGAHARSERGHYDPYGSAYPPFVPGDTYGGGGPPGVGRQNSNYQQASYPVDEVVPKPTPNLPNPFAEPPARKVEPQVESADDAAYGGYVEDDVEEEVPKRVLKIANGT